jgi:hypothetical protein
MYRCRQWLAPLSICAALILTDAAKAAPIDYIFTGTAAVTLGGVSSTSLTNFELNFFGDTNNVTNDGLGGFTNIATSAAFTVGASSGTLLGISNQVSSDVLTGGIIFGQAQPAPAFVLAGLSGVIYDLSTSFPLTAGLPFQGPGAFFTSLGDLSFDGIETMSFEAILSETPVPAALPLFATGLGTIGLLTWRKRKKPAAA